MTEEKNGRAVIKVQAQKDNILDNYSFEVEIKCKNIQEAEKHYQIIKKDLKELLNYKKESKWDYL